MTGAQHRKGFGRRGKLEFTITVVEAVDGQRLRLEVSQALRGKDLYGIAGVVTILTGPFGVFVKGRDIEVPAGTEYTVYTAGERWVRAGANSPGREQPRAAWSSHRILKLREAHGMKLQEAHLAGRERAFWTIFVTRSQNTSEQSAHQRIPRLS